MSIRSPEDVEDDTYVAVNEPSSSISLNINVDILIPKHELRFLGARGRIVIGLWLEEPKSRGLE